MKRFLTYVLLGLLGIASSGYSREIPDGVKEYMEQLQNDPSVEFGFEYAKMRAYLESGVQFKDWHVGLPFQYYDLPVEAIENADEESEFEDLMEPTNRWCIPIRVDGYGYAYHVLVEVNGKMFRPYGCGGGVFKGWDKVREKFPEESGVIPMFAPSPFALLYFPDIEGPKKIFHVRPSKWDDPMSKATSNSLDSLDEARTIVPLLKDKLKRYREQRKRMDQRKREYKEHLENHEDESGGAK